MKRFELDDTLSLSAQALFACEGSPALAAWGAERMATQVPSGVGLILDRLASEPRVACAQWRLAGDAAAAVRFTLEGGYRLDTCPLGGWLVLPDTATRPAYWLPRLPRLSRSDDQGHILAERPAALMGMDLSPEALVVGFRLEPGWQLDGVCWRFPADHMLASELTAPASALERQPWFLWGSKVNVQLPAGLYHFLLHGSVYTDDFVWPRRWKFRSELDALGLFQGLTGLHQATGKTLYDLLRRQLALSVLAAQAEDGGWHHGEWTDLMEVHLRLHNAAMILLEAVLEESADPVVAESLRRAADFLARFTDQTDLGVWFLHDSLETSEESMEIMRAQTNTPWIPSHTLGKSPCTKLILNTHLDALVVLDRYQALTGDRRFQALIDSGRAAARGILALRPAEGLYRGLYRIIELSLLPKRRAQALPLPLRALKRLGWQVVQPNMHRFKRRWPRLVMPGGLIERHIAPLHYDVNYHPVNVMDIVRLWRRFPGEDFTAVIEGAIAAVERLDLLEYWGEAENRRFAIVTWADAMYQLCLFRSDFRYRKALAGAMLAASRRGLGLPPALLGADAEAIAPARRKPCPLPPNPGMHIANLPREGAWELLLVNALDRPQPLDWLTDALPGLVWKDAMGNTPTQPVAEIPPQGWLLARVRPESQT